MTIHREHQLEQEPSEGEQDVEGEGDDEAAVDGEEEHHEAALFPQVLPCFAFA